MHFQNRHRKRLYPLPTGSKNCCSGTGGSTYQGFFSSRRSGTTFTKAMYRNPPEVKGRIQATVSPAQIRKALVITETEPWETTQTGKKIHKDDKHCLPPSSDRRLREPYLLLLVTEHILQSRLLEFPPELWKAASWLHSSGQSQPEVGLQSLQPKNTKS